MIALVTIGIGGIALLLALILWLRLQPFVALLVVSIAVGLAAGLPPARLATTLEDGLGGGLGHVALIIALGAMIGRIVEESGGAQALARALVVRFGEGRAPLALAVVGFLIGIPIFFEVGVIMLMPLADGIADQTKAPLLSTALPMCLMLLVVHALLPPHPGAVATATLLHAEFGRVLMFGLPIAGVTAAVGFLVASRLARICAPVAAEVRERLALAAEPAGTDPEPSPAPPVGLVVLLILLPVALIAGATGAGAMLPARDPFRSAFEFLGTPFVALLIDVLLCAWGLGLRRGWSRRKIGDVMGAAIPGVALVILITGGGAMFAKVLVTTGVGGAAAQLLHASGLPLLAAGFLLTSLIRAVQGPTTVALVTAAGILAPFSAAEHLDANRTALLCVAMGAGGMALSHVNDAGFWIVTRLLGLTTRDGLRTWTLATTCAGLTGFVAVCAVWKFA